MPRRRYEDIVMVDLQEVGWEGTGWLDLVEDRENWRAFVNNVMYFWVP